MNKPTPGPWKLCGANEGLCPCHLIWSKKADCVVAHTVGVKDEYITEGEGISDEKEICANAALIVAAVNACFAINPDNPMAVAEALPEIVSALAEALAGLDQLGCADGDLGNTIRIALAKIEAKT